MKKEIKEILKLTKEFLKVPSVTYFEKPFLNYLNKKIKKLGYKTIIKDDYLVVLPNSKIKPNYLFSAHIDRHGFIQNENNDIEYLAFYYKKRFNLTFKKDYLEFFENAALRHYREKVNSYDENSGKIIKKYNSQRYYLDFPKKNVFFYLNKNTKKSEKVFMFNNSLTIKEDLFFGQIDNVISVAVLFYLLKSTNFKNEIIFTTKEEIGFSWKNIIEYLTKKNKENLNLIVLDTTPYSNFNNKTEGFIVLRKGDENGLFNLKLVKEIESNLKKSKFNYCYKPSNFGMTELGRVSNESKGKINGATIQIPTTNYHTTCETATIKSLENYYEIIKKLSKK